MMGGTQGDEGYEAWRAKYAAQRDAARALRRELSPLEPGDKTGELVWLYRRSSGSGSRRASRPAARARSAPTQAPRVLSARSDREDVRSIVSA